MSGRDIRSRSWSPATLAATLLPLVVLLSLAPRAAGAQQPSAPAAIGAVRGVVWDSLAAAPLAGARVWTGDGARAALTDSAGRFVLDSVPAGTAPTLLMAEHPQADSVGLATLLGRVRVVGGDTAEAVIAIPAFATLRAAACAGLAAAGDDEEGILFGTVRDAASGAPLPGARVSVTWRGIRQAPGRAIPELVEQGLDATADETGTYYACGLPTSYAVLVRAAGEGAAASGEVATEIGARRIRRRDLAVGAAASGTIVVTVVDSAGRPLAGARVYADDGDPVTASTSGRAVLRGVGAGTRTVGARSIGFTPAERPVDAAPDDTLQVELRLSRTPYELAAVRVSGFLAEIESRGAKGFVLTGEALASKSTTSFIVPMDPRVQSFNKVAGQLNFSVRNRRAQWCIPTVLLDGRRSDMEEISMYRVDELLAVELYLDARDAPQQYVRNRDRDCGMLLVWTKPR